MKSVLLFITFILQICSLKKQYNGVVIKHNVYNKTCKKCVKLEKKSACYSKGSTALCGEECVKYKYINCYDGYTINQYLNVNNTCLMGVIYNNYDYLKTYNYINTYWPLNKSVDYFANEQQLNICYLNGTQTVNAINRVNLIIILFIVWLLAFV